MKKLSTNTELDAEFNEWALDKEFGCESDFQSSLTTWRERQHEVERLRARVAELEEMLADRPVPIPGRTTVEQIANTDAVSESLGNLVEDPTEDNGLEVVRAVLAAAKNAPPPR